ncbi:MAG: VOC family protein [Chloroflexota bacterium]|nr:VOC family protein [Anaerolineales bacterium]MCB8966496.1 VOC family protein [Ardenticatenaceae bacterium]
MPQPFTQQVTFLYTADLQETAVFYETILELPLILDQGACRIYRVGRSAFLGFCQHLSTNEKSEGVILTLVSDDVDGWYAYLRQKGVVFEKAPTLNEKFNIYHCFLRDPNGYLLEIQRFLNPIWPENNTNHASNS